MPSLDRILPNYRPSTVAVHCMNPSCQTRFSDTLYVDSLHAPCPRCGEKDFLYPCDSIHLIQPSLTGPLLATSGKRYQFVCNLARQAWNHGLKHPGFPIHQTFYPELANCPDCLRSVGYSLGSDQQFHGEPVVGSVPATLGS